MTTEKIKEFVNNSELPQLQKNVMNGFIDRAKDEQERKREDRQLIEQVANEKKLSEVVLSTDEVKIYTVSGKDEWDIKYPFRSIYVGKKGTWERSNTVSPTDKCTRQEVRVCRLLFSSFWVCRYGRHVISGHM